jgi:sigma-B regulation protein RsbU (phosphoserine phosphatase)
MPDLADRALQALLEARQLHLAALAGAWLDAGASAFALYRQDAPVACWPSVPAPDWPRVGAPLQARGRTFGELRVYNLPGIDKQLAAQANLLSGFVMAELDCDAVTGELVETQDQILALYNLMESMRDVLGIEDVLHKLTHESTRLVKVEATAALLSLDGEIVVSHHPQAYFSETALMDFLIQARGTGEMSILRDDAALPPGVHNLLIAPMTVRGEIRAVLGFINNGNGFQSPELKFAQAIVAQGSARLENAVLYRETLAQARLRAEMELAEAVQVNLLPQRQPLAAGIDWFGGLMTASQVGGDFYDFVERPGGPLTFTVGDVSGKGMPAALLMAMTRTVFRSQSRAAAATPAGILNAINADLYDDFTQVGMFATAFVGQYDPAARCLTYANAGHSPVVYRPHDGKAGLLKADSTALGVLPDGLCADHTLALHPGDLLIVATDGFNEARDEGNRLFGYDNLLEKVDALSANTAQEIAAGLFEQVSRFAAGHPQDDDQTIVIIKGAEHG